MAKKLDASILEKYKGLRVTDVCDGMDALGMQDIGLVDREIHPLWRDIENFTHRVYGLAHTVRFVPTNRKKPDYKPEGFDDFKKWGYGLAKGPFTDQIKPGDMIVIDGEETGSVGYIGSNNAFSWIAAGAVGVVTNGGCRDTDELIKQKVPVYSRYINRTIRPGRLALWRVPGSGLASVKLPEWHASMMIITRTPGTCASSCDSHPSRSSGVIDCAPVLAE